MSFVCAIEHFRRLRNSVYRPRNRACRSYVQLSISIVRTIDDVYGRAWVYCGTSGAERKINHFKRRFRGLRV